MLSFAQEAGAQMMASGLAKFITDTAGFTTDEITRATSGTPVVKVLRTTDSREVALIGVVRVRVPRDFYVGRVATAAASADSSSGALGVFSTPAKPQDVASFSLPHNEVEELAKCRPGSCKLKLPGKEMVAARAAADSAPSAPDSAVAAYFARRMIAYVTAYRSRGKDALVVYEDAPTASAAAEVWDGMLSRSPYVYAAMPSLARYLANYPHDRPPGLREAIYWTEDDVPGAKTIVTITHQIVYDPPEMSGTSVVVSKQLYCDHYLDGGLDLMAVVDAAAASGTPPASDVVFIRRLHFDDLPSGGIVNVRGKVISRFTDETRNSLRDTKRSSEQAFAAAH
jgi:hypothetical protein